MRIGLAIALGLVACGDNFGPAEYSGHFHIELARNDANHSTVVELSLHPTNEVALRVAGGTATMDSMGYLAFSTEDEPYRLQVTADGETFEVQHHAGHLELTNRQAGRRHPAPYELATNLTFAPSGAPAEATYGVATTGLWSFTTIGASPSFTFDWLNARFVDSERGLLGPEDKLFLVAYEACNGCAAPHVALTRVLATTLTQSDGGSDAITGELAVPTERLDVNASIGRAEEIARVAAAYPFDDAGSGLWGIDSIPASSLAPIGRLPLVASPDEDDATDVTTTVVLHNPFTGTEAVAWLKTTFDRPLDIGQSMLNLPHGTLHFVPAAAETSVRGLIGVPAVPSVTSDGTDFTAVWDQAIPGRIDDHVVTLFEIVEGVFPALIPRHTIVTDRPKVIISRVHIEPERKYLIRVDARLGYPFAFEGNYVTVELPFATATTWSGVFDAFTGR